MLAMQYRTDTLKPSFFPQEIMKINSDSLIKYARSRLAEVSPEHLKMSINSEGFCSLDLTWLLQISLFLNCSTALSY